MNGSNANLKIIGDTGDISNLCQLGWFEWCYFRDRNNFPYQEEKFGHCLGPTSNYSNEMPQFILKDTMKITASHTVRALSDDEMKDLNLIRERDEFMVKCRSYHGDKMKVGKSRLLKVETVTDDEDEVGTFFPEEPVETSRKTEMPEQDVVYNNGKPIHGLDHIVDSYINIEVRLPEGEKISTAR